MTGTLLSIEIKPGGVLTPQEQEAIANLFEAAFEEAYEPFQEVFTDPTHILGKVDGKLVSHALWITRWLALQGRPALRTAYVEAVATDQAYRKRGYATQIMACLAAQIQDYALGGLSPADTSLYARLGWEFWQGPLFGRKDGKWIPIPGEQAMILRTRNTPELDLHAPLSIEWRDGEVW
jgi:aminoglycoside 2'-N-acetyltransferase I